jgi:hypothetical protein
MCLELEVRTVRQHCPQGIVQIYTKLNLEALDYRTNETYALASPSPAILGR